MDGADVEERVIDHGPRRVALLDALVAVLTVPLVVWLSSFPREVSIPIAIAVGLLFLVAEWFPVDVEFREQGHTVAFTAVPLVVGLCFLPPVLVIALRVAASVFVLGVVHRQSALKFATNVVSHALQVAVAAAIIVPFIDGTPEGIANWGIATLAVLAAEITGTAVVTAAISLSEGEFDAEFLDGTFTGWGALIPDAALGLATAILIEADPAAVVLLVIVGATLGAVVRAYARVTLRYRVLEVLDSFTAALGTAVVEGHLHETLLSQMGDRLHAGTAWIQFADRPDERILWQAGGQPLRTDDLRPADRQADRGDALVGTVQVGDARLLVGVGDRLGEVRAFDGEDRRLFDLLVAHAGVALQNVRLVDQLRHEARINADLATRDQLTGLPNRTQFLRDLEDRPASAPVGVLLLGIDRFKEVNDTLGHQRGDELLIDVGERLRAGIDAEGSVARLGGDEFAVLWATSDAHELLDRSRAVLAAVNGLYEVAGMELDVALTGGLAVRTDATDAVTLLRQADVAMYLAKSDRQPLLIYSADRDTANAARLAMAGRLRSAISARELTLNYQPQIDLATDRVIGVEALVRWTPTGQQYPVSPIEFIDVAERTGLIHSLTRLVLDQALEQAAAWAAEGLNLRVSANLSARNLEDPRLVDDLHRLLAVHGVDPRRFEVEVTETSVMLDPEAAIETLRRIHDLGVSISIDDFGTGHSSLAYLAQLPVDQLKIDRSFVMELTNPGSGAAVVNAIIDLGHALGVEVVAEGVETPAHVEMLTEMGADVGQGYVFARPLPADEVADFVRRLHEATDADAEDDVPLAPVIGLVRPDANIALAD